MKIRFFLLLIILSCPALLPSQEQLPPLEAAPSETTIDWNVFHMGGLTWSSAYRSISDKTDSGTRKLKYQTDAAGVTYTHFAGSTVGFFTQINGSFPFRSRIKDGSWQNNTGVIVDITGAVGASLKTGGFGFMPFAGFHAAYTFLSRDPYDYENSSHMASFGLSLGCNFLYYLNSNDCIYAGLSGYIDTIELTTASYDSRNTQADLKICYMISIGYAYTPGTVKKVLQPDI